MYKKILILLLITPVFLSGLWAGDAASFVDLGFSPDGKVYIFAQYGIQSGTLRPWADLFIVDVPNNNFVPGGRSSYVHTSPVSAGQDGSGALFRLIARNAALAERHGVDFLFQSQPLYVSLNGEGGGNGQTIEFRDFEAQANYRASLVSTVEGSSASLKSSFYINLERTDSRGTRTYVVGTPQLKRPLVASYRIRKAMIAPHDGSLIFVIEMHRQGENGSDIRYMVEAVRL
ncbi:MAG: DUF2259 domain-containing protein [Spirochaetaceae bacterium]|jgi:predicted secreted protein|nr:DUF2259 domain-containing protein [Spirochaetaceae bacterium]